MPLSSPRTSEVACVDQLRPLIIKRKKVAGGDGHHGGAWKVAYADFATAMMAFFLLMWLVNATSEEQRKGLADFFDPSIPLSRNSAGGTGMMNGEDMMSPPDTAMSEEEGDRDSRTRFHRTGPPSDDTGEPTDGESETPPDAPDGDPEAAGGPAETAADRAGPDGKHVGATAAKTAPGDGRAVPGGPNEDGDTLDAITETLQSELASLGDDGLSRHFSLRMTPEGLVIEIGDLHGEPLFGSGAARPEPVLETLIQVVAPILNQTTNDIAVVGHTDAAPFVNRSDYSNWELSADRANAARRLMTRAGLPPERIVRVSGRADTDPIADDPNASRNRRIAITLLRKPLSRRPGN